MKITFLGAAHEVTGSMTLIEVGDKKGLVDCGMEQGKDLFVNEPLPIQASQLDFVLLTHAHIDHAGKLPLLYKQGFRGPIYATAATCSLCDIMLRDCANIQMSEAEYKNRKGQRSGAPHEEPLYDLDDAIGAIGLLRPCDYGRVLQVNDCVSLRMTDVGHLLGSAAIEVWLRERGETRKITFSGDVGNLSQPILRDPQLVEDTEYLVIESTYGDRLHTEERVDYVQELAARIQATLDRGGNMVIPSFAVGRTQEMLYFIREIKERGLVTGHGDFPVYVDSPLAIEATSVFLKPHRLPRPGAHGQRPGIQGHQRRQDPQGHPLRLRHVRRGPGAASSQAQSLAAGEHGALRGLPGRRHPGAHPGGRGQEREALRRGGAGARPDRHPPRRQRPRG